MKALRTAVLFLALSIAQPAATALGRHCFFSRQSAVVRYGIEKMRRERFARQLDERVALFLATIPPHEREWLERYGALGEAERAHLIARLRKHVEKLNEGFRAARCRVGQPADGDEPPGLEYCVGPDDTGTGQPYYTRSLRLFAYDHIVFLEATLRDQSQERAIRAVGEFGAGEYFVRVTLGDRAEERAELLAARGAFMSGFESFESYARRYSALAPDCLSAPETNVDDLSDDQG